jgi:2,3-dihydroxybiphenyl 1,2-dioxygenase
MSVCGLGYVGLNVSDLEGWRVFLQRVFAMQVLPPGADGSVDVRVDEWQRRFTLHPGAQDGLAYIGWEVGTLEQLHDLVSRVESTGIAVKRVSPEDCARRRVLAAATFSDPVESIRLELFCGPTVTKERFTPARAFGGYATGEQGLGHVVLMTHRQDDLVSFYRKALGFEVSDYMSFGGEKWGGDYRMVFMHCNARHHSLAIMSPPSPGPGAPLNHIALSVRDFNDVGYAYDVVIAERVPVLMTIGRHINDLATSFYVASPSGFAMEMAHGAVTIGENWKTAHYDDTRIWGHHLILPPAPVKY